MASRLLSRFSRGAISAAARPIGLSPARPAASAFLSRPNSSSFVQSEMTSVEMTKVSRQQFIVNPTLQRFGYSSSASSCQPVTGTTPTSAQQVSGLRSGEISKLNYQKFSSPYTGLNKFLPYTLLFRWIEEIILDYVHHEVTRNMVMLYLRLFLIIVMKDVFIGCYDLLTPQ